MDARPYRWCTPTGLPIRVFNIFSNLRFLKYFPSRVQSHVLRCGCNFGIPTPENKKQTVRVLGETRRLCRCDNSSGHGLHSGMDGAVEVRKEHGKRRYYSWTIAWVRPLCNRVRLGTEFMGIRMCSIRSLLRNDICPDLVPPESRTPER